MFKWPPAFTLGICCRHSLRVWSQARPQQKETWPAPGCACVCVCVSRRDTGSTSSLLLFVSVDPRVNQNQRHKTEMINYGQTQHHKLLLLLMPSSFPCYECYSSVMSLCVFKTGLTMELEKQIRAVYFWDSVAKLNWHCVGMLSLLRV